jgi:hypothetical protein
VGKDIHRIDIERMGSAFPKWDHSKESPNDFTRWIGGGEGVDSLKYHTYKQFVAEGKNDHHYIVAYDKESKTPLDLYGTHPPHGKGVGSGWRRMKKWARIQYPNKKTVSLQKIVSPTEIRSIDKRNDLLKE